MGLITISGKYIFETCNYSTFHLCFNHKTIPRKRNTFWRMQIWYHSTLSIYLMEILKNNERFQWRKAVCDNGVVHHFKKFFLLTFSTIFSKFPYTCTYTTMCTIHLCYTVVPLIIQNSNDWIHRKFENASHRSIINCLDILVEKHWRSVADSFGDIA